MHFHHLCGSLTHKYVEDMVKLHEQAKEQGFCKGILAMT